MADPYAPDGGDPDVVNAQSYAAADVESQPNAQPANPNRNAAIGTAAIGGGMSAIADIQAGRTTKEIADQNKEYALAQEAQDRQAGQFAAVRRGIIADQLAGRTRASQSASGTVVGAGSNRLVVNDQRLSSNMDQYMLRLNAGRQAFGAQVRAAGAGLQGDLAQRAGETGAVSTLLNTGSNAWLYSDPNYDPRYSRPIMS